MEVAAYRQPSVLGRKRAFGTCKAKTEVSIFGAVDDTERARQRFRSELVAARGLLEKALAALSSPSEPRSEEPPVKKIKGSPFPPVIKRKKMTRAERDLLAAGLAELASELPDNIIKLLKKHSRGISGDEMEIDINSVEDEALLEIKQQLDQFVRERAADPSPQDGGKMLDEDEEEDVDIVGGVSPLVIAPAPLQLAEEEDEYVDICGDESPAVDISCSPRSSTSSNSGSDESQAERDATLLFAQAKEYLGRSNARAKARQEVLETERRAMPSEKIHPTVLQSLRIDDQYNMARHESLLRQFGLFIKVDDYDIEEQQHRRQGFQHEDLEEGEILG